MGAERRGYLPGAPDFKGKIKPSKPDVKPRKFPENTDKKFDPDTSLVGNAGNMEADIAAEKMRKSEVADALQEVRGLTIETGKQRGQKSESEKLLAELRQSRDQDEWEEQLEAAKKRIEEAGNEKAA
ncbi:MAG: hypothetical protein UT67_C0018G0010 [Candidatus Magasanikbacteria bacterium GW2011_GWA2_40_10]|uniref:Uncharacterized protein n=1 Tax=Candidatus Magasanikbacteria bacterium GW2011_GWA2_40_10 TaxID=1619037 RepID=A0A0G0Q2E0_9BACT|nr:MAG: hypothetical protein UT67_C0018G0010 [Candidatus Magasanikbacteria bacterium GW2011_GWA2_40_10]